MNEGRAGTNQTYQRDSEGRSSGRGRGRGRGRARQYDSRGPAGEGRGGRGRGDERHGGGDDERSASRASAPPGGEERHDRHYPRSSNPDERGHGRMGGERGEGRPHGRGRGRMSGEEGGSFRGGGEGRHGRGEGHGHGRGGEGHEGHRGGRFGQGEERMGRGGGRGGRGRDGGGDGGAAGGHHLHSHGRGGYQGGRRHHHVHGGRGRQQGEHAAAEGTGAPAGGRGPAAAPPSQPAAAAPPATTAPAAPVRATSGGAWSAGKPSFAQIVAAQKQPAAAAPPAAAAETPAATPKAPTKGAAVQAAAQTPAAPTTPTAAPEAPPAPAPTSAWAAAPPTVTPVAPAPEALAPVAVAVPAAVEAVVPVEAGDAAEALDAAAAATDAAPAPLEPPAAPAAAPAVPAPAAHTAVVAPGPLAAGATPPPATAPVAAPSHAAVAAAAVAPGTHVPEPLRPVGGRSELPAAAAAVSTVATGAPPVEAGGGIPAHGFAPSQQPSSPAVRPRAHGVVSGGMQGRGGHGGGEGMHGMPHHAMGGAAVAQANGMMPAGYYVMNSGGYSHMPMHVPQMMGAGFSQPMGPMGPPMVQASMVATNMPGTQARTPTGSQWPAGDRNRKPLTIRKPTPHAGGPSTPNAGGASNPVSPQSAGGPHGHHGHDAGFGGGPTQQRSSSSVSNPEGRRPLAIKRPTKPDAAAGRAAKAKVEAEGDAAGLAAAAEGAVATPLQPAVDAATAAPAAELMTAAEDSQAMPSGADGAGETEQGPEGREDERGPPEPEDAAVDEVVAGDMIVPEEAACTAAAAAAAPDESAAPGRGADEKRVDVDKDGKDGSLMIALEQACQRTEEVSGVKDRPMAAAGAGTGTHSADNGAAHAAPATPPRSKASEEAAGDDGAAEAGVTVAKSGAVALDDDVPAPPPPEEPPAEDAPAADAPKAAEAGADTAGTEGAQKLPPPPPAPAAQLPPPPPLPATESSADADEGKGTPVMPPRPPKAEELPSCTSAVAGLEEGEATPVNPFSKDPTPAFDDPFSQPPSRSGRAAYAKDYMLRVRNDDSTPPHVRATFDGHPRDDLMSGTFPGLSQEFKAKMDAAKADPPPCMTFARPPMTRQPSVRGRGSHARSTSLRREPSRQASGGLGRFAEGSGGGGDPEWSGPGRAGSMRSGGDNAKWERRGPATPPPHMHLHKAENSYKVGDVKGEDSDEEVKQRAFMSLLNKLTVDNYERLLGKMLGIQVTQLRTLSGFVDQIFNKALTESIFCPMYAKLCSQLNKNVPRFENPPGQGVQKRQDVRSIILQKCQQLYEARQEDQKQILQERADAEAAAAAAQDLEPGEIVDKNSLEYRRAERDKADKDLKRRRRALGNVEFLGHLFKVGLLTEKIIHINLQQLLGDDCTAEDLECGAKLLSTVGENLAAGKNKPMLEEYIKRLHILSKNERFESRIRFMLLDVIEMSDHNWQPRREKEGPRSIESIHREYQAEIDRQKRQDMEDRRHGRGHRGHDPRDDAFRAQPPAPNGAGAASSIAQDQTPVRALDKNALSHLMPGLGGRGAPGGGRPGGMRPGAAGRAGRPIMHVAPVSATPVSAAAEARSSPTAAAAKRELQMEAGAVRTRVVGAIKEYKGLHELSELANSLKDTIETGAGKPRTVGMAMLQISNVHKTESEYLSKVPEFLKVMKEVCSMSAEDVHSSFKFATEQEAANFFDENVNAMTSFGKLCGVCVAEGVMTLDEVYDWVVVTGVHSEGEEDDSDLVDSSKGTPFFAAALEGAKDKGSEAAVTGDRTFRKLCPSWWSPDDVTKELAKPEIACLSALNTGT